MTDDSAAAPRRVLVIHNPAAGRARRARLARVLDRLTAAGCLVTVRETGAAGDAERLARKADAAECDVLVIAGGDGTINEAVNGLVGRDLPLGLIPLGTANVLAAEIGLPDDDDAIAGAIAAGPVRAVYVGLANGRAFAMMASAGFDARVVAGIGPRLKRLLGKGAYVARSLAELARLPRRRYRVEIDGASYDAASVVIANGHYYAGRFTCAPEARLEDPDLHVCLFRRGGRLAMLRYAAGLALGRLHRLADVTVVRGRRIRVEGLAGEPVQGDGDVLTRLPVDAAPAPHRLNLVHPRR